MENKLERLVEVQAELPGTWMVPLSLRQRTTNFAVPMGIGSAITALLFYFQFQNNAAEPYMLWGFGVFAVGTFLAVRAFGVTKRRTFDFVQVYFTNEQRVKRAAIWLLPSFAMLALIWGIQLGSNQFLSYWWYAWPALLPTLVGIRLYWLRSERVVSSTGQFARAQLQAVQEQKELERNARVETTLNGGPVRYLMAAAAAYGSYYFAFEDSSGKNSGWLSVGLLILTVALARELGFWLLGIGVVCLIGWALLSGVAALPVSVAVIIGALIIASAVGKK